jgi:hypothetical protein
MPDRQRACPLRFPPGPFDSLHRIVEIERHGTLAVLFLKGPERPMAKPAVCGKHIRARR